MSTQTTRIIRFAPIFAAALVAAAGVLLAGPLTPPPGPVSSTPGPEARIAVNPANTPGDADSLLKITQPGSYYLTANITGVIGKHGIEIAASGVTLDLNGFDLVGIPAMGNFDGVSVTGIGSINIAVCNGSIRGWGDSGLDMASFGARNSSVINVRSSGNGRYGIGLGTGCLATGCLVSENAGDGIWSSVGCTITTCSSLQNTGSGIAIGTGSTINGCTVYDNTGNGILAAAGSLINTCTVYGNTLDGIRVTSQCTILTNNCSGNGAGTGDGAGIHTTGTDNRIEGNTCIGANRGIDIDAAGNIIIKNLCSGNTINWAIAIGNSFGPIVVAGTNAAAVSTNGAVAGNLSSTDPNANFSY